MDKNNVDNNCPITACLSVIGGKWKPLVLFFIASGIDRFGMLQRKIPAISKQMLTRHLRELEADGIISRKVYAEVPPRVEYSVTEKGESLYPVIDAMRKWGELHLENEKLTSAH